MTYTYKLDNFLIKPVNGDKRLFIYDKDNNFIDSITSDISHYFVKNNCLVIKITNKNDLILSFDSRSTAQSALEKLDNYRKSLMTSMEMSYWVSDISGGTSTTMLTFLGGHSV